MEKLDMSKFTNVPKEMLQQVEEDIYDLGISPKDLSSVDVVFNATELIRVLKNRFALDSNVLIYGTKGFGKTQMVAQAAEACGMAMHIESTATKLPEDYGGIPMALDVIIPKEIRMAMIRANIRNKKVQELVQKELDTMKGVINPRAIRRALSEKYGVSVQVTDDELQAVIDANENLPSEKRLEQRFAAPDWIYRAIDLHRTQGKKTLVFFDELNQASATVMNALFGLIENKRFADRMEYDVSECMVFAAAGNFRRENMSVQPLPAPLMDRFQKTILFYAEWTDSIDFLKDTYLQFSSSNPQLAVLLGDSSISDDAWAASFTSPRTMEVFLKQLKKIEDMVNAGKQLSYTEADISSFIQGNNVTRLRDGLLSFWKRLGIYGGTSGLGSSAASTMQNRSRADAIFKNHWTKYKSAISHGLRYTVSGVAFDGSNAGKVALYNKLVQSMRSIPSRELLDSLGAYQELLDAGVPTSQLPQ